MASLRVPSIPAGRMPDGIFFYNPNIHPLIEFRRRVKALQVYLERDPFPAEIDDTYGLQDFLAHIRPNGKPLARRDRCRECYRMRLGKTARLAREKGYETFSSTLLASREQDRDLVAEVGRETGKQEHVEFVQADLRTVLPDKKALRGIYRQQYCGCIFSEEERFGNTNKHLYHPDARSGNTD
jgi:Uncharacterized protein conserved in bacteria